MANPKKSALGRGLSALLEHEDTDITQSAGISGASVGSTTEISISQIEANPFQPRTRFESNALEELAESIRLHGVIQPVTVRKVGNDKYQLISGERRFRASQLAGLVSIPAYVRVANDQAMLELALVENIQREDLNPMEEAASLQRLQLEFDLTQQEVATAVGKSRSTVANLLRLMSLQEEVRRMLERGDLEMGHARALLGLEGPDQTSAARTVAGKGLTVRQTEALVRQLSESQKNPSAPKKLDPNIRHLQDDISQRLGAPVAISHGSKGRGKVVISYNSLDELDGILGHIR